MIGLGFEIFVLIVGATFLKERLGLKISDFSALIFGVLTFDDLLLVDLIGEAATLGETIVFCGRPARFYTLRYDRYFYSRSWFFGRF